MSQLRTILKITLDDLGEAGQNLRTSMLRMILNNNFQDSESEMSFPRNRRDRGLTLIELIVVMAILVILAGLTLPKLDVFKLKANKAQAAANITAVANYVSAFRVQHDVYPDVWDSMLDSTSNTTLYPQLHPSLTGGVGGSATKMSTSTITADELKSLNRVGILTVVDNDPSVSFPNNSGTSGPRTLTTGDTVVTVNAADPKGAAIIDTFYPDGAGVPSGKKIAVFALGPRSNMIGDVLVAAPFYANADQLTQYARFLVAFELSSSGGRARMLGALGSDGDTLEEESQGFYKS